MSNKVLVIGAVNIDIFAKSDKDYVLEDSNVAKISLGFGGVGGNIATNLSILNQEVSFLSAFSNDILGNLARSRYQDLQIDIKESLISDTSNASVYLGIMDKHNDLFLGLNDMTLIHELTIEYLNSKVDYINSFDYIVLDTNFEKETLAYFFKNHSHKHLFIDAVSAEKVVKLKDFLPFISTLKCNKIELNALSDQPTVSRQIHDLLRRGVKELLVTDKDNPVIYASNETVEEFPVTSCNEIVNATGAGDAFLSGYIKGFINNQSLESRILEGMTLARKTLQVNSSTIEKGE